LGPIPNPQSPKPQTPTPNPQKKIKYIFYLNKKIIFILKFKKK